MFNMAGVAVADQSTSVEVSLQTVRSWLMSNAPPLVELLNAPASEGDLVSFEKQTGLRLPRSVRAAYAIHDGETPSSQGLFGALRWLPLTEVTAIRRRPQDFGVELTPTMIPVLVSGGGDYHFVDSVADADEDSAVFEWWHEQPARERRAASFAWMLEKFAESLGEGQYIYQPDEFRGLIHEDDF